MGKELLKAAAEGDLAKVQKLLKDPGVDVNYLEVETNTTPLIAAVKAGHIEIVKVLLTEGHAEVDACKHTTYYHVHHETNEVTRRISGVTALNYAVDLEVINGGGEMSSRPLCQLLLETGANPNIHDIMNLRRSSSIHWAIHQEDPHLVKLLLQHGAILTPFDASWCIVKAAYSMATKKKKYAIVNSLIEHGADFNVKNQALIVIPQNLPSFETFQPQIESSFLNRILNDIEKLGEPNGFKYTILFERLHFGRSTPPLLHLLNSYSIDRLQDIEHSDEID